jgi:hypothetical protein
MKVYGKLITKVDIDPIAALEAIIDSVLEHGQWVKEEDGKYFIMEEDHQMDYVVNTISKEKYEFIKNIKSCINYLRSKTK